MKIDAVNIDALNYVLLKKYSSYATTFQLLRQIVPHAIQAYITKKFNELTRKKSNSKKTFTLVVDEYNNTKNMSRYTNNVLYNACLVYLSSKLRSNATRLKGCKVKEEQNIDYRVTLGEIFVETLENKGIEVRWKFCCKDNKGEDSTEGYKFFELKFDLEYKDDILDGYIPLVVIKYYDQVMAMKRELFLHTVDGYRWSPFQFKHPFTFDSLALDPDLKKLIIDDLDRFIRRKEFYKKVGKAWKRGYLLYGPPGTGKSSLVAAMANYLRFSIYDLQLSGIHDDAALRKLMLATQDKSILVIEDIDCTIGLSLSRTSQGEEKDSKGNKEGNSNGKPKSQKSKDIQMGGTKEVRVNEMTEGRYWEIFNPGQRRNQNSKVSLSGLLIIIDGLWSSCGDERIIIFTTNHKEKLDPALVRPGRMDMHIHMSYLTMKGFRVLANNYLGVSGEHPLFDEIEPQLKTTEVTPAQVAEELIRTEDVELAVTTRNLIYINYVIIEQSI